MRHENSPQAITPGGRHDTTSPATTIHSAAVRAAERGWAAVADVLALPASATVADIVLAISGERQQWEHRVHAAGREGFRRGRAAGIDEGRALEVAEQNALHRAMAARILRGVPFTELERRRWGPGGREHFGDPRRGDYPGQQGRAA